jgi:hypothetical protein
MPWAFGSPEYWRSRAKESCAVAEQIGDPEAKAAMFAVAQSYAKIAERAEAGMKNTPPKSS